jgi:hypothetical protein
MRHGLALAAVAALMALPCPASADHIQSSASISAQMGATKKDGSREVTVSWNVSCTPGADSFSFQILLSIKPKNPSNRNAGAEAFLDSTEETLPAQGSRKLLVRPGRRVVPEVIVECFKSETDPNTGDSSNHSAPARASALELYVPPAIAGYSFGRHGLCGFQPTKRNMRKLQVGQFTVIEPALLFNGPSVLRRSPLKEIKLVVRGGGLRKRISPDGKAYKARRFEFALGVPRRPGKMKVWAEFDGTPTGNKLTIPVLPRRC